MRRFAAFRVLCLFLYYGMLRHLPASNARSTKWVRVLRRLVCAPLFNSAGANINIERGASFGTGKNLQIGNNSGLGVNCRIIGQVAIGDDVMMGPDVLFLTTAHRFDRVDLPMIRQGLALEKKITVSNDVWIGARCIFLPGVTIGEGSVIGAGSVVTRDIPAFCVAAGNPARVLKMRR